MAVGRLSGSNTASQICKKDSGSITSSVAPATCSLVHSFSIWTLYCSLQVLAYDDGNGSLRSCVQHNLAIPPDCSNEPSRCRFTLAWWDNLDSVEFTLTARTLGAMPVWAAVGFSDDMLMVGCLLLVFVGCTM